MADIAWFKEISKEDIALVGGKGANLGEMYNADFPIPPGFVVTAEAYKRFVENSKIQEKLMALINELDVESTAQLEEAAKKAREMILNTPMPEEIKNEIIEAYENLNIDEGALSAGGAALDIVKSGREPPYVAVRSSATAEDLPEASFAGQQATYLNVKGGKGTINAVQNCWASLFTARAVYYRVKNKFPHDKVYIAVVVQKMVNSDKAGVMFSVNPVNNQDDVLIEAGFGLGEAVVSGSVNPDQYIIDKKSYDIKEKKVNKQSWMYTLDPNFGKTVKKDIPAEQQEKQVLSDYEAITLAKEAVKIEDYYKKPQDMEFAIEGKKIYIVQSRPITTLKKPAAIEPPRAVAPSNGGVDFSDAKVILSGLSAGPGRGTGPVKIIREREDINKLVKGDVLVADMTNPDYVAAMEKSSAIVTNSGGSTCFDGTTKILTNKGFMTISEIYEDYSGITVPSINRKSLKVEWKPVVAVMKRKAEAIEIGMSQTGRMKGNCLRLTPDHKMLTFDNRSLVEKKICDVIDDNDMLLIAQNLPAVFESSEEEMKKAYLLGALMTDGSIDLRRTKGKVQFIQKPTEEKKEFIGEVIDCMSTLYNKDVSVYEKKVSNGFIRGKPVVGQTNAHCWASKAIATQIKQEQNSMVMQLLCADRQFALSFLAGVIDGDGSYNHESNRINIYIGNNDLLEAVVVGCMRLGIVPQVSNNRTIHNLQIVENVEELLSKTKRVKGEFNRKVIGTRFFSARQLLSDVIDDVNYLGRIKPYVKNNLIIDSLKIKDTILPMCNENVKNELNKILQSDVRMIRTSYSRDIGEIDVYNITVENNHNYLVFTDRYTPIVVNNCHAAIVGREMGIPVVVGTMTATEVLKDGQIITVDATNGKIYDGVINFGDDKKDEQEQACTGTKQRVETVTEIKVIMDLPDYAQKAAKTGADGVGLLRGEFINLAKMKVHPGHLIKTGRKEEFVKNLEESLKKVCEAFRGKPVWYRTLDAPTDEFRNMEGGENEPHEDNPMLGWRSIRRSLDQPELLKAEYEAIKRVHDSGMTNLGIMIPLVTHVEQIRKAKKILREVGIEPQENIDFGVMVETPAAVQIIEEICEEGIDFVSFGTNDLTQFTLAIDRNSAMVQKWYDEMHPAVLRQIKHVIDVCRRFNVETSICGQAGSRPEMAEFLVKAGIDSISANPDAVEQIRWTVARAERKLLLKVARQDFDF